MVKKAFNYKFIISMILVISMTGVIVLTSASRANADVAYKPAIDVEITSMSPKNPKIGEDIVVSGRVIPKPFEAEVPAKEIVLVLDVSASMKEAVSVPCTNERVEKYCTIHGSADCVDQKCVWEVQRTRKGWYWYCTKHGGSSTTYNYPDQCNRAPYHNLVYDYCTEHGKSGDHNAPGSTKIEQLKKAAKNFVNTMKDVPNLKIGIVAYSTDATINPNGKDESNPYRTVRNLDNNGRHDIPNYTSIGDDFIGIDDTRLTSMIDGLEALGGTNTGEGLRKAEFLLEKGDSNANKTVVLMSDGLPTFYSVNQSNTDYYTSIDDTDPGFAGKGSGLDSYAVSYATTIGNLVKETANNVFSIGYGLGDENSQDNQTLKQIHQAMGGTESNFFASDNGAIDSVFQNIATEILESYAISNIKMEMNFASGLSLNIGGNTVDIDNIIYKTDEVVKDGRVTYSADPVTFQFVINGSEPGKYELFGNSKVTFPWENGSISATVKPMGIEIGSNELPNIKATLNEATPSTALIGQDITVTYDIKPENFVFQDSENESNSDEKEIVFLLDTSKDGGANYLDESKHLWSGLLNDYNKKDSTAKFGLVTYSDVAVNKLELTDGKEIKNELKDLASSTSSERNIGNALKSADDILTKGKSTATKYIIIMAAGDVTYDINKINAMKNKGYNIITLKLGTAGSNNIKDPQSVEWLHNKLWGSQEDYFNASIGNNGDVNNRIKEMATRLRVERYKSYVFDDVKLNFNIGDEFQVVSGLKSEGSGSSYNYGLEIPEIRYTYDVNSKEYKASGSKVSFVIKPTSYGELKFKDNNTITYTNLIGKIAKANIETPVITVKGQADIHHGIYDGYDSSTKKYNIDTTERTLAKEATATFGATFETYSSKANLGLKVPTNIALQGAPKVYKVDAQGNLQLLGEMALNTSQSLYSYTLGESVVEGDNIVVLYTITLPKDEGSYENIISVDGIESPAKFKVGEEALPDLF